MAKVRFPGRPGYRIGKASLKYFENDFLLSSERSSAPLEDLKERCRYFYEIFGGSSDEVSLT